MPEPNRVVIDRVDWKSVLPVLRLASAFKHALQPGKLAVALVAVLAIHLSGTVLDLIWGDVVESRPEPAGVYETAAEMQALMFTELVESALSLNFGLNGERGVVEAIYAIVIDTPRFMFSEHLWFTVLFGLDVLFVLAIATGLLTRMSASQICANRLTPLGDALGSVHSRWVWYVLTPLMPVALIVVVGLLLALAGLVFFNIPGVDVAGALAYGLFLLLGFVIAVVGVLLLFALFLMPPALSVEGSDGFDAIARSFNYILFRPWQFGVYLLSAVLYLAVVYLLVGTVASLSISAAGFFLSQGVVSDHEPIEASAWIMARWIGLVSAIATAVLLSTFCCLQTQVYVLMRRSADGTPMDQCDGGEPAALWETTPEPAQPAETTEPADAPESEG